MKFEVPHRQHIASDPDSALFVRSGPFHHFLRPVNAELVSGEPFPYPGVDRPLRGNCHPLFCAPDNQVRCVFGSAPYQKQASTVRNTHSVLKKASCGTRRIFRSIRCKKQASTVREGYSVPETAFSGTLRIFKVSRNSTCHIERIFKGALNSLLLHRMHFRKRKNGILLH